MHDKALLLVIRERAKLHKAEEEATLVWPCQCTIQALMGVLCYHNLFHRLKDGGQVLPGDIHPFWWYDRTKQSTALEKQVLEGVILDLAVVKGKGRPKGSKGKKGSSIQGMTDLSYLLSIIVLILYI